MLKDLPPLEGLACLEELERMGSFPVCALALFFLGEPGPFARNDVSDFIRGYAWPGNLVKGILQLRRYALSLISSPSERMIFEMIEEVEYQVRRDVFALVSAIFAEAGKDLRPLKQKADLMYRMEKELLSSGLLLGGREIMELFQLSPGRHVGSIRRKIRFLVATGRISSREEVIREIQAILDN